MDKGYNAPRSNRDFIEALKMSGDCVEIKKDNLYIFTNPAFKIEAQKRIANMVA